jgi:hypothetical protein
VHFLSVGERLDRSESLDDPDWVTVMCKRSCACPHMGLQVCTRVYVQAYKGCVTRPRLESLRLHPWLTSKQFRSQTNSTGAIRWFRSTFFNTTIVAQPEWNHSRLSHDCSVLEELWNSTIAARHARRSDVGCFFFQGHSACVRTLPSSKHAGHYNHTSKAACNVATVR